MPSQTSSENSMRPKKRITNQEIWSSLSALMDEIVCVREELDYIKTITQNTFCVLQRMENYNLLTSNNKCNYRQSQHVCHKCEVKDCEVPKTATASRREARKYKKVHAVKSLINIQNKTTAASVSVSSLDSSVDSLLTSFVEHKSLLDEVDCNI